MVVDVVQRSCKSGVKINRFFDVLVVLVDF